jgi:hypothetical protein
VDNLFNSSFLFASLFWGSVGVGYFIFGKKQGEMMPLIGGIVMVAVSYFVSSWLLMTLICVALIAAIYFLMKRGY